MSALVTRAAAMVWQKQHIHRRTPHMTPGLARGCVVIMKEHIDSLVRGTAYGISWTGKTVHCTTASVEQQTGHLLGSLQWQRLQGTFPQHGAAAPSITLWLLPSWGKIAGWRFISKCCLLHATPSLPFQGEGSRGQHHSVEWLSLLSMFTTVVIRAEFSFHKTLRASSCHNTHTIGSGELEAMGKVNW
jgi:hypothetical protein